MTSYLQAIKYSLYSVKNSIIEKESIRRKYQMTSCYLQAIKQSLCRYRVIKLDTKDSLDSVKY